MRVISLKEQSEIVNENNMKRTSKFGQMLHFGEHKSQSSTSLCHFNTIQIHMTLFFVMQLTKSVMPLFLKKNKIDGEVMTKNCQVVNRKTLKLWTQCQLVKKHNFFFFSCVEQFGGNILRGLGINQNMHLQQKHSLLNS